MSELIFTDPHYYLPTSPKEKEKALEIYEKEMRWLILLASKHQVTRIRILGDLFHQNGTADYSLLNLVGNCLHRFSQLAPVDVLVGNHDYITADGREHNLMPFSNLNNVTIVDKPYWGDPDTVLIPYMHDFSKLKEIAPALSLAKVIMAHGQVRGGELRSGIISESGMSDYFTLRPDQLLLVGDYHVPHPITNNIRALGALRKFSFNDSDDKPRGAWILKPGQEDRGTLADLEFIQNPYSPRYVVVEVNSNEDINLLNGLPDAMHYPQDTFNCMIKLAKGMKVPEVLKNLPPNVKLRIKKYVENDSKFVSLSSSTDLSDLFLRYLAIQEIDDEVVKKRGLEYLV